MWLLNECEYECVGGRETWDLGTNPAPPDRLVGFNVILQAPVCGGGCGDMNVLKWVQVCVCGSEKENGYWETYSSFSWAINCFWGHLIDTLVLDWLITSPMWVNEFLCVQVSEKVRKAGFGDSGSLLSAGKSGTWWAYSHHVVGMATSQINYFLWSCGDDDNHLRESRSKCLGVEGWCGSGMESCKLNILIGQFSNFCHLSCLPLPLVLT